MIGACSVSGLDLLPHRTRSTPLPQIAIASGAVRSCPPEAGMVLGIRDLPLETALEEEPWQGPEWKKEKMPLKLPMFIECAPDDPRGCMVKDRQSLLIRIREGMVTEG